MKRHINYLIYVLRHKWFVFLACMHPVLHVPLSRAIFHDMSKFSPLEWFSYARCFYKPDGSRNYDDAILAPGWMHHQHVNDHHWQYWLKVGVMPIHKTNVFVMDSGGVKMYLSKSIAINGVEGVCDYTTTPPCPVPMSDVAIREMIADWIGAGRGLGSKKNAAEWYRDNRDHIMLTNGTRERLEMYLTALFGIAFDKTA